MDKAFAAVARVLLVGLLVWLSGCTRSPDEAALRAALDAMAAAVEARDAGDFMEGVADDFTGDHGMDRGQLQSMLRLHILRNARIGVTVLSTDVQLQGDRATVVQRVVLTGGQGSLLPERARPYRIESGWRWNDGRWQVYAARWGDED